MTRNADHLRHPGYLTRLHRRRLHRLRHRCTRVLLRPQRSRHGHPHHRSSRDRSRSPGLSPRHHSGIPTSCVGHGSATIRSRLRREPWSKCCPDRQFRHRRLSRIGHICLSPGVLSGDGDFHRQWIRRSDRRLWCIELYEPAPNWLCRCSRLNCRPFRTWQWCLDQRWRRRLRCHGSKLRDRCSNFALNDSVRWTSVMYFG